MHCLFVHRDAGVFNAVAVMQNSTNKQVYLEEQRLQSGQEEDRCKTERVLNSGENQGLILCPT